MTNLEQILDSGALPAIFLSHGAPTLPLEDCPARAFLQGLAAHLPRPKAIVVCSAHYEAAFPRAGTALHPKTIYDFRGFPDVLYQMRYPAPGAPDLAAEIVARLQAAGFTAAEDTGAGLDHGIWNPLIIAFPKADIPVVPLSIVPDQDEAYHYRMGLALADLRRDDVLLVGSGSMTHNLRRFFTGGFSYDSPEDPSARGFADWIAERAAAGDTDALLAGADAWPEGRAHHPTDDHILPLHFALGAGGEGARGFRLHASTNYGILAMDALGFG